MIKVLHTEWSDGWGGQEIRIISEMLALRERGVEVYLACRSYAKIKQKAEENGIKVFTLPFSGSFNIKTILGLKKIIKEYDIDIVNTHSGKDTWTGGIAAKLANVKFIRTRHLSNKINPSRLNFINELADFIFTTGENVKKQMIKYNRINSDKIISIPTGVDENIFNPQNFNKIDKNEIYIGALGVVRGVKGYEYFIESAIILLKKYNNLKFFIAGDGPMFDKYKQDIENLKLNDKIIMLGHVKDTAEFLSTLDIFVNSSKSEGVSQAIIQALMMNLQVVATDVGSTRDLWRNNNFLLCQSQNSQDLADKIEQLIIKNKFDNNSREYMIENFSKKAMTEKILTSYKKVMS